MAVRKEQRWSVWFYQSVVVTDDACRTDTRTMRESCFLLSSVPPDQAEQR